MTVVSPPACTVGRACQLVWEQHSRRRDLLGPRGGGSTSSLPSRPRRWLLQGPWATVSVTYLLPAAGMATEAATGVARCAAGPCAGKT